MKFKAMFDWDQKYIDTHDFVISKIISRNNNTIIYICTICNAELNYYVNISRGNSQVCQLQYSFRDTTCDEILIKNIIL